MPVAVQVSTPGGWAPGIQKLTYTPAQVNEDCQKLKKAMKGLGTDEKALIQVLGKRTPDEVVMISKAYQHDFGKDLQKELKSETSGDFCKLLLAITTPPAEFDAQLVRKAIEGLGTDEALLVEVLVGRNNAEIRAIRDAYQVMYDKDISKEVKDDLSGDMKAVFAALLEGNRDEAGLYNNVEGDAEALYKAGEGRMGTDEKAFINILATRQDAHLRNVFEFYQKRHKKDIIEAIKKEFSGDAAKALIAVAECIQNRPRWIARQFEKSMAGIGTDENKLIRLATRFRHPSVIGQVKEAYQREHGKSLGKRIHGETSGDFRKLLLELIGDPNP